MAFGYLDYKKLNKDVMKGTNSFVFDKMKSELLTKIALTSYSRLIYDQMYHIPYWTKGFPTLVSFD